MKRLLLLLLCLAFLGGCHSRKSSDSDSSDEVVLYHQLRAKVLALDPADIGDTSSHAVGSEIFEGLYRYHYLKRPYELIPELAVDMPQVSEDGLVYTIEVKKGVFFHNDKCFTSGKGREVTARDFVYSWMRVANIKTRSKMWWMFDGRIEGLDEFREYSKGCPSAEEVDYDWPVAGLKVVDDYKIVVTLNRPWPQFMYVLAYPVSAVIPKEAVDHYGETIINHPVGTGPFVLKTWRRGSYIEMVKNPNYRVDLYPSQGEEGDEELGLLADAGKQMPFVDKIIWRVIEEDQPRWLMFMRGDIDITSIPKDNFGSVMASMSDLTDEMVERGIKLKAFQEPDAFWIGMNNSDPVIGKNKPLRLALSKAFDGQKWIELFFNGRGVIAYGYIPPNMPGYDPNIKDVSHIEYNPEKAREYVARAVKINGGPIPELTLTIPGTDTTYRQMGRFLRSAIENIGLAVEVEYIDWPTYMEKLRTGSVQLYSSGWIADWPDVENFMNLFYSKNSPYPNNSFYSNPEYDKIYEQISVMEDCPQRTELYRKAQRIMVADAPVVFLYHRIWYALHHDWVGNLKPNAYKSGTNGYGFSKYYRVDAAKRKTYQEKYK